VLAVQSFKVLQDLLEEMVEMETKVIREILDFQDNEEPQDHLANQEKEAEEEDQELVDLMNQPKNLL